MGIDLANKGMRFICGIIYNWEKSSLHTQPIVKV